MAGKLNRRRRSVRAAEARARRRFRPLVGEALERRELLTLTPQLVADINDSAAGVRAGDTPIVEVNGSAYFSGSATEANSELWKVGPPSFKAELVKDINPGENSSDVSYLTNVAGTLFFVATNGSHGRELWKSDGTATGTMLVKDIAAGAASSEPRHLINVGGTLYFAANDRVNGETLWKSDGTATGTSVVAEGLPLGSISGVANVSGSVFFGATGVSGGGLWRTDGTEGGTVLIKDVAAKNLTNVSGTLFFSSGGGVGGGGVWKSDGTNSGTVLLQQLQSDAADFTVSSLTPVNTRLYFLTKEDASNWELWSSDGTEVGTSRLQSWSTAFSNTDDSDFLTPVGDRLFYRVRGDELWKTEGVPGTSAIIRDMGNTVQSMVNVNGHVYFSTWGTTAVWKTDGTMSGTVMVQEIVTSSRATAAPDELTNINGLLFFRALRGTDGRELWMSNGEAAGTRIVERLGGTASSLPDDPILVVSGTAYFAATKGASGTELWKSDGTAEGTQLVKDIRPGVGSSNPWRFVNVNGTVFFLADDGVNGPALWKTDGSENGTVMVKDFSTRTSSEALPILQGVNVNGTLLFAADDDRVHGLELWRSDGTESGTVLVKDIIPGSGGAFFSIVPPVNVNGTLFFVGSTAVEPWQLFKSDGTPDGTVSLKTFAPGLFPSGLTNANGTLYFTANDGVHGMELWKSDGTEAGTVLVKDILPGPSSNALGSFTTVGEAVFFVARNAANEMQLWQSDGTGEGTVLVKDALNHAGELTAHYLVNVNGTLLFVANDGVHGREVWKSDGTRAGTVMVDDAWPGATGSAPRWLANVNGTLFFSATDGVSGRELWRADSSLTGVYRVGDIARGGLASDPRGMQALTNDSIIFAAGDGLHGRELWTLVERNAAPSFATSGDLVAHDDGGPRTVVDWATNMIAGPPDESEQEVRFEVEVDKPELFLEQPRIDASGKLTFTPMPNRSGLATVTVTLIDDGGTADGGIDRLAKMLMIEIVKPFPLHNVVQPLDVTDDGAVVAGDVLAIINWINAFGSGSVPIGADGADGYLDVNGDNFVSASDALEVINYINAFKRPGAPVEEGEGETVADRAPAAVDVVFAGGDWLGLVGVEELLVGGRRKR